MNSYTKFRKTMLQVFLTETPLQFRKAFLYLCNSCFSPLKYLIKFKELDSFEVYERICGDLIITVVQLIFLFGSLRSLIGNHDGQRIIQDHRQTCYHRNVERSVEIQNYKLKCNHDYCGTHNEEYRSYNVSEGLTPLTYYSNYLPGLFL